MKHIFISHSGADVDIAKRLESDLSLRARDVRSRYKASGGGQKIFGFYLKLS